MRKWIKYPGPGEMRGEGEWYEVAVDQIPAISGPASEALFTDCRSTGYLPTAEQDDKPKS